MLRERSELLALPRFGCSENYMFTSAQLNIAPVVSTASYNQGKSLRSSTYISDYVSDAGLGQALGAFGEVHDDGHDCFLGMSCMQQLGEFDEGVNQGWFHLLEFGVAWKMEVFTR